MLSAISASKENQKKKNRSLFSTEWIKLKPKISHFFGPGTWTKTKWFFIAEFERAAKIRKIYRFLISFLVPELQRFEDEFSDQKVPEKAVEINQNQ